MTKTLKRPRLEIRHAQDNGPTPERAARSDWEGKAPKRVLTTVQALLNAGDITQDAANAADRWYRDYVFGKNGYVEFAADHVANDITKHDAVSWNTVRAQTWGLIVDVRMALGAKAHRMLTMMLIDEMSFAQMGKVLCPSVIESSARRKIAAQCALLMEQLYEFYRSVERKKEKTCTPRADLVLT